MHKKKTLLHSFVAVLLFSTIGLGFFLKPHPVIAGTTVFNCSNYIRGDANLDGQLDISDPIKTLGYLFTGGTALGCLEAANANGQGTLDISDPIYSLAFLFTGGPRPPAPFPNPGSLPPILDPIDNTSVTLGDTLILQLHASDPEHNALRYSAGPLPLPEGATFLTTKGELTWKPAPAQVGDYHLTFTVTDGKNAVSRNATITVNAPAAGTLTQLTGTLLDSQAMFEGSTVPVVGATVSLFNTGKQALSDVQGRFILADVPAGDQILDINAITAVPGPNGVKYANFREKITLIEGTNNIVQRPFYLPRLDTESETTVDPQRDTMVENADIGVSMEIPAGTAKNEDGSNFTSNITISEVPTVFSPVAKPDELHPALLITIQPLGVSYTNPVKITFPNNDGLAPGSIVDLWSLNPDTGAFIVVGKGQVTPDGRFIVTIEGGVRKNDWHFVLPPQPVVDAGANNAENINFAGAQKACIGSENALCSGNLIEEHSLTGYRSLGEERSLKLVYNSSTADPQPIISSNVTISALSAVPDFVSTRLRVGGADQGVEIFTDTGMLNENIDETIRQAVQFDASALPTGIYPYRLMLMSYFGGGASAVGSAQSGNVLVNNQIGSLLGAGWSLGGLQRLQTNLDSHILLIEGDSAKFFKCEGLPGLTNWWKGEDNADDSFGTNHGAPSGGVSFGPGKTGKAFVFNGIDSSVSFGSQVGNFGTADFTVDFWFLTTSQERQAILAKRPRCNHSNFWNILLWDANQMLIELDQDNGGTNYNAFFVQNSQNVFDGNFHHMALVRQGTTASVFVDSVLAGSRSINGVTELNNPVELLAGTSVCVPGDGTRRFQGKLDELHIFNRALSSNEILAIFEGESLGQCTVFTSPAGDFSQLVKNADGTYTRTMKDGIQYHFNAQGLQTSMVDRNGNTTAYEFDAQDRLVRITDPVGLVTQLVYSGNQVTVTDPAGRPTILEKDAFGNLIKITDPDGSVRRFEYDSRHRLIRQTNKRNLQTVYTYNFAGRNVQAARPDGSTRKIVPIESVGLADIANGVGQMFTPAPVVRPSEAVATYTDGNGNETRFLTDKFGAATTTTDALGRTTTIARDADSNPVTISQPNGTVIALSYDAQGNLLTTTDRSIDATTTLTYESVFNQVTSIKDPNDNLSRIEYDAKGNPVKVIDAQNQATTLTYNAKGQLTEIEDALSNTTGFEYDAQGNLIIVTDPRGFFTILTYDTKGNVATSRDGEERITRFAYDALNRLTQVTDAASGVTRYEYDTEGNLTAVVDAKSNRTTFEYDALNRLVKQTDPLGIAETFKYDANGNLIETTDRKVQTLSYEYDKINQLVKKTLPGNLATSFDYDEVGNLKTAIDPDSQLAFGYDGASRLTSVTTAGSANQPAVALNYAYDKNGNRLTMIDSLVGETSYVYDVLNRLASLRSPTAQTVGFDYDELSRRKATTWPNGVATNYAYDAASQLTSLAHKLGAATISSFGYSYDKVGNRTVMNTTRAGVAAAPALNYVYDTLYRLTQATRPLVTQPNETFNYDSVGNRVRRDGQASDAQFDRGNRLLSDAEFNYAYDNNGNLTQKTAKAGGAITRYTYDAENQLTRIDFPGGTNAEYRYDALGRRIEKKVGAATVRYVYDGEDILFEFDGANKRLARYTHGPGIDEPLIMERDLNGNNTIEVSERFFYHTDGLGSITELTTSTGTVAQSYIYDSFGNIVQQTGAVTNPYTYTGREFDSESGLYYYRARYYDSRIGRFLNEDPIGFSGGDVNFYSYVSNSPLNFSDPYGLSRVDFWSTLISRTAPFNPSFTFLQTMGTPEGQTKLFSLLTAGSGPEMAICPIASKVGNLALGRFSGGNLSSLKAFARKYGARILEDPPPPGMALENYLRGQIDKAEKIFFRMKDVQPGYVSYDVELKYILSNPILRSKTRLIYGE